MTKPKTQTGRRLKQRRRSGMTMIELLVAISILVIIAAILVPQLRFASADRNIREASRMVASMFAQASQRAINDGVAGVVIERNPNILDADGAYAGTSMFILRKVPAYIGEDASDMAEYLPNHEFDPSNPWSPFDIWIPEPFEEDIVRAGDQISFNDQPLRLSIDSVEPQTNSFDNSASLRLRLSSPFNFVAGNITNDGGSSRVIIGKFSIHRQPRKLVSSRIDMPAGYLVDLRLSGELNSSATSFFNLDNRAEGTLDVPNSITYLYNGRGAIDRYFYTDASLTRQPGLPKQPAYLMVREYSTDENGELIENVLNSERQMWVTVEPVTGAASVISGVPVDLGGGGLTQDALREARKLGSKGQAAQ